MIIVIVRTPAGRDIYVNGDYDESHGVSPAPIDLNRGAHKLETLDANGKIDYRGEIEDGPDNRKYIVDLNPVVPPEATP